MLCRTRSTGALSGRRTHASLQRNQSSPKVPPSGVGTTVRWYLACTANLRSVTAPHRELARCSRIYLRMQWQCTLCEIIAAGAHMMLGAEPYCSWAGEIGATSNPGVAQRIWQFHEYGQCQICQRGWVHTSYKGLQRPGQVRRGPIGFAETISAKLPQRPFAASYAWKSAGQRLISRSSWHHAKLYSKVLKVTLLSDALNG